MANYFLPFAFVLLIAGNITAFPLNTDWQRRDLQNVLESTAKKAESIGKAAIRFFVPRSVNAGMAVVKPFLRRRRSAYSGQQPQWPKNYWWINNNARSAIIYPNPNNNWFPSGYFNTWQFNPYFNSWTAPASRSLITSYPYPTYPYSTFYPMQPYYNSLIQPRIMPYNQAGASAANDNDDTKASLQDFDNLVSQVDSALLSFTDKAGVTLQESLKGVKLTNKAKGKKEEGQKRSKSAKDLQNEQVNVITKTFTDFVCGQNC